MFKNSFKNGWKRFAAFSIGARIALVCFFLLFLFEAVIHLMPVFWVVNTAFKNSYDPLNSFAIELDKFTFQNIGMVFSKFKIMGLGYFGMLMNSLWTTVLYIFVNVMSSTLLAYALARFRFPGKDFLYGLLIFIRTIPIMSAGSAGFKLCVSLGMINNPLLIWLGWAGAFDYTCFILYGTFKGISGTYSEAAEIEGANQLQILFRIIFPQAFPAILALAVTNITGRWNDFSTSQIYLSKYPNLAYGLYQFANGSNNAAFSGGKLMYYASLFCAALPVVVIYATSQGLILKNIAVGGIKG